MKCPICEANEKFIRTYETITHKDSTERRKLCIKCSSSWKTIEQRGPTVDNSDVQKNNEF